MNRFLLITGNDDVAVKYRASKIIEDLKEAGKDSLAIETISCETEKGKPESALEDLIISINTPSFLTSSKTIWGKHCDFMDKISKPGKTSRIPQLCKDIIASLENEIKSPTGLSFIFDGPNLEAKSALYKFFKENGEIIVLDVITAKDKETAHEKLMDRIKEHCQREKKNIAFTAVQFLTETIGSDSARIFNELNKIIAYTGSKDTIELSDCKAVATKTVEAASWVFADSLAERKLKASFETLNQLIEQEMGGKAASSNIELAMLHNATNKFINLAKAKANAAKLGLKTSCNYGYFKGVLERNTDPGNELASQHPFKAFKLFEHSLNFTESDFARIMSGLLDANKELVSGNTTPRIVLENLIVKICGNPKPDRGS